MSRFILICLAVCIGLLAAGCSQSPPKIEQLERRVVFRDSSFQHEELMIYLRVSDPDDDDDPNEVVVTADGTGFKWRFQKEEWFPVTLQGKKFWGMPAIIPYNEIKLPNTLYIVTLADMAGQKVESRFRLNSDRLGIEDIQWPKASIQNGQLQYSGTYSEPMLILRLENLDAVDMQPALNGYVIPANQEAAWWEIWINIGDRGSAIRLGPWSLTP